MKRTLAHEGKANGQAKSAAAAARSGGVGLGLFSPGAGAERPIFQLQRAVGNRAVRRWLQAGKEGAGAESGAAETGRPAHAFERLPPPRLGSPGGVA